MKYCQNCKWWSGPEPCVCVNDRSEHLSDFVYPEQTCEVWEASHELDSLQDGRERN